MKRIDIIGAPGAGKSTLVKNVLMENTQREWLTSSEAINEVVAKHFSKPKRTISDFVTDFAFRLLKSVPKLPLDDKKYSHFLSVNTQKYNLIIDSAFHFFYENENSPSHIKAKRMGWLVQTLEQITLLEHYCDKCVLFDESLSSKLFSFVLNRDKLEREGINYLSSFNLPDGFIFIHLEYDEIISRLDRRPRITFDHARMSKEERIHKCKESIENVEFASNWLLKAGVNGLILDGKVSIEENSKKISEYLKGMN